MVDSKKYGVSPVIGIILLTAVTVVLVGLASVFVFDVGQSSSSSVGTATVTAEYASESRIDVQLLKQGSSDEVVVRSALGTEYTLNNTGDTVVLLNQDGNKTPVVLSKQGGERTVLREIPPRSFTADIVVSEQAGVGNYQTVQNAVDNANDGDVIVIKRGVYYENIDIRIPNITVIGETGTVIADNTSDSAVVDVQAGGVRVSNIDVNASSSQGGTAAEYGISTTETVGISSVRTTNARASKTDGDVVQVSSTKFVDVARLSLSSSSGLPRIPITPDVAWKRVYDGGNGNDIMFDAAVDSNDNVIVTGREETSDGGDWRTVKYAENGSELWTQTYQSGNGFEVAYGVVVDSDDNVVVVGRKQSSTDGDNWRVVKYNSTGSQQWIETYSGGNGFDAPFDVAVDRNDNVIVAGDTESSSDGKDWRVAKYDSEGNQKWVQTYSGGNGIDRARAVDVDSEGNIFVAGYEYTSDDKTDWRIVKYSSAGTRQWVETYSSGNGNDKIRGLAVGKQGNVFIGGISATSSSTKWRVVKYNSTGSQKWVETYNSGNGSDSIRGVNTDNRGDIIVVGGYASSNDDTNWRVVKYNASGGEKWVETYESGNGFDSAFGVGVGHDFISVAGSSRNTDSDWRIAKYEE